MNSKKFRETYKEEALDYLDQIEQGLLSLENNNRNTEAIDSVFRAMHSLKGGASMFGFPVVSELSHHLESTYDNIRSGSKVFNEQLASLTFKAVDLIRKLMDDKHDASNIETEKEDLLAALRDNRNAETNENPLDTDYSYSKRNRRTFHIKFIPGENILNEGSNPVYLIDELTEHGKSLVFLRTDRLPPLHEMNTEVCYFWWEVLLQTESSEEEIKEVFMFVEGDSSVEVNMLSEQAVLDDKGLLNELLSLPENENLPLDKLRNYTHSGNAGDSPERTESGTIRVASEKIDNLIKIVGEMVTFDSQLATFASQMQNTELMEIGESLRKLTGRLREVTFDISLVPLSVMMLRFKRLVRDLSLSQGKQVVFLTAGEETQLDKTVVDHLYEPLLHILRNSISHGIESKEDRKAAGKTTEGTIKLKAYYSGPEVYIEVSDDGRGFDTEKIKKTALEKGFIKKEDIKTDDEILNLTFLPGFSTMAEADNISGRGVGMDVIRKKIQEINGEVLIDSEPGKGTTLRLVIPLTLSIVDGLTVKVDDLNLVLPVSVIDRIESVSSSFLRGNKQVLSLEGESIPAIPLFFDMESKPDLPYFPVVVIRFQDRKYGLIVHEVTGTSQVVLKSLGKFLKKMDVFSGGCVLGNGTIAYVIDIRKFISKMQLKGKHLNEEAGNL